MKMRYKDENGLCESLWAILHSSFFILHLLNHACMAVS